MWASIANDPKAWSAAAILLLSPALAFLWKRWDQWRKAKEDRWASAETRLLACEMERASLREKVTRLEGSVEILTKLLKKEVHIGA